MNAQLPGDRLAHAASAAWSLAAFASRHAFATAVCTGGITLLLAVILVLFVVFYFLALLGAVLYGGDVGGIATLPASVVVVGIAWVYTVLHLLLIILPSAVLAELVTTRLSAKTRYPAQMGASTLIMLGLCIAHNLFLSGGATTGALTWWAILLIPLGVYWWLTKAVELGLSLGQLFTLGGLRVLTAILRHAPAPHKRLAS